MMEVEAQEDNGNAKTGFRLSDWHTHSYLILLAKVNDMDKLKFKVVR
jgi:hypothetical protein